MTDDAFDSYRAILKSGAALGIALGASKYKASWVYLDDLRCYNHEQTARKRLVMYHKARIPAYIKLTKNKIMHDVAIDRKYKKMPEKDVLAEDKERFPEHYI